MKKLKGDLTISIGEDVTRIDVGDKNSRIRFLSLEIPNPDFLQVLGRLARVPCDLIVRNLENVGRIKEQKEFQFLVPNRDKKEASKMAQELCPEGWTADTYFGSHKSFKYNYEKDPETKQDKLIITAHTFIYRYVDPEEVTAE